MRLLLDESVPARLRHHLSGHAISTVGEKGWSGVKNGLLLAQAATCFDAFITVDKNLPYQQNLKKLPISVVVLDTNSNELSALLPIVPKLLHALISLPPQTLIRLSIT
jgi:predicted nuclease of predicted toxin-antitoxin system